MPELKRGDEHIMFEGMPTGYLLGDFWRWSSSDLLDNTLRGTFSEFIVATALGLDIETGFENWLPWDLTFPCQWTDSAGELHNDIRIEVKSAAFLQSWEQTQPSNITFSIRPTIKWEPDGHRSKEHQRQSDVYVFCLYAETKRRLADPLKLDGWEFFVVPTHILNDVCGPQKTISLNSLRLLRHEQVKYSGIRDAVIHCMQDNEYVPPPPVILHNFCISVLCINTGQSHKGGAALSYYRLVFSWRSDYG